MIYSALSIIVEILAFLSALFRKTGMYHPRCLHPRKPRTIFNFAKLNGIDSGIWMM